VFAKLSTLARLQALHTLPVPFVKNTDTQKLTLLAALLGFAAVLTLTLFHQQPPLFDEAYFVRNFALFEKHGLSAEFLRNMDNQAPGPLYELVHFAFRPLTHLTTPGIRLVNVFLLAMTILLLTRTISILTHTRFGESLPWGVALIAVPMVWQVTGLALTEMPTMFFSVLTVLLLLLAIQSEEKTLKSSLLALAAGASLGLSILGRSPFLTLGLASGILLLYDFRSVRRWRTLLLFGVVAMSMAIPVFIIWGGLVPPQQAFVGKGYSGWHGILAYAYGALLTVIIAPRWFYFRRSVILYLALAYIVFLLINIFLVRYEYAPLDRMLGRVLPGSFMKIYPLLISPLLATLSLYFIASSLRQAWIRRSEPFFVFILFAGLLLLASSFKVTHLFSTRYVAQAAPMFVLLFPGYDRFSWSRLLRFIAGMAIGYLSLETYFHLV